MGIRSDYCRQKSTATSTLLIIIICHDRFRPISWQVFLPLELASSVDKVISDFYARPINAPSIQDVQPPHLDKDHPECTSLSGRLGCRIWGAYLSIASNHTDSGSRPPSQHSAGIAAAPCGIKAALIAILGCWCPIGEACESGLSIIVYQGKRILCSHCLHSKVELAPQPIHGHRTTCMLVARCCNSTRASKVLYYCIILSKKDYIHGDIISSKDESQRQGTWLVRRAAYLTFLE